MKTSKQDQKNELLRLVLLHGQAEQHLCFEGLHSVSAEGMKQAKQLQALAMANLLEFVDEIIDGFGFSPGVQQAIDAWNERNQKS